MNGRATLSQITLARMFCHTTKDTHININGDDNRSNSSINNAAPTCNRNTGWCSSSRFTVPDPLNRCVSE